MRIMSFMGFIVLGFIEIHWNQIHDSERIHDKIGEMQAKTGAKLTTYFIATWLGFSLFGYGMALRDFAQTPGLFTQGNRRPEGAIARIKTYGFGKSTYYRVTVENFEEFSIPPEFAYPLTSRNSRPDRLLSDLLHEGLKVRGVTTGGPSPILLGLTLEPAGGIAEEVLYYDESVARYLASQAIAASRAAIFEVLGTSLLPLAVIGWWLWAKFRPRPGRG